MEEKEMQIKSTVSVAFCDSYNEQTVYEAVKRCVDALGGLENFVSKEEKILLKPNFLYPSAADKCITTHPSVIRAAIRLLCEDGYFFRCGDSPASGSCASAFEKLGLDKTCIAPMDHGIQKGEFCFAADVLEADAIIGLCKMKTHALERITGAVKNMYGLIYGKNKAFGHVSSPSATRFAKMLVAIHKATPQRLHIMDAVVAMEGNGPASGSPVRMNLILASKDPVALDTVFCRLIHLDPCLVPTNTCGYVEKLGTYKEEEIGILLDGSPVSMEELTRRFGKPDFDVQREEEKTSALMLLSHISNRFGKRPVIDEKKCVKCGVCVEHCPVEGRAVSFKKGRGHVPVYDYAKCIRCFCCQELCPAHAISVKNPKWK